ncbi:multicopper oxidase family protein [Endozoicomonas arenosclerae]|uniref:multicopper oxidase family protein n=1 Tax=Endozoicomonas arenosclerae TaxID=1633495 RepID=UPI00155F8DCF|nr:multicopper oxidase family protein [Endozoicomonas arenosclerae]
MALVVLVPQQRRLQLAILWVLLVFCSVLAIARPLESDIVHSGSGLQPASEPLQKLASISSQGGTLSTQLDFVQGTFQAPCHNITTRMYRHNNVASVPGPTLRLKRGDLLDLTLFNTLPKGAEGQLNHFRLPNTTNFHTHGLHVSSRAPADDVLSIQIKEGEQFHYQTRLPGYHAPGIFWYHPHQHGSTALQVGGGAAGAIVVEEDASDQIPADIAALEKELVMFNEWNLEKMKAISTASNDQIWKVESNGTCLPQEEAWFASNSFITANGQYQPYLAMEKGQWKRLQLINAAFMQWLSIPAPQNCEFQLLAKDGIFLKELPRQVDRLILPGGGRVDLAVRCSRAGERALISKSEANDDTTFMGTGTLMYLDVKDSEKPPQPELKSFKYAMPCYLPDLTQVEASRLTKAEFRLQDNEDTKWFAINDTTFNPEQPVYKSDMETVQEWTLVNADYHSFHLHVSPFQLPETVSTTGNYFQIGDWHDTLFIPYLPEEAENSIKVRFQPERYTGNYVMHCHILPHEDQGMMAYAQFAGEEGKSSLCPDAASDWPVWKIAAVAAGAVVGTILVVSVTGGVIYCTPLGAWLLLKAKSLLPKKLPETRPLLPKASDK